ncbi:hypothetical protein V1511DRAFT_495279 [Dipodascopsis uninucleata]
MSTDDLLGAVSKSSIDLCVSENICRTKSLSSRRRMQLSVQSSKSLSEAELQEVEDQQNEQVLKDIDNVGIRVEDLTAYDDRSDHIMAADVSPECSKEYVNTHSSSSIVPSSPTLAVNNSWTDISADSQTFVDDVFTQDNLPVNFHALLPSNNIMKVIPANHTSNSLLSDDVSKNNENGYKVIPNIDSELTESKLDDHATNSKFRRSSDTKSTVVSVSDQSLECSFTDIPGLLDNDSSYLKVPTDLENLNSSTAALSVSGTSIKPVSYEHFPPSDKSDNNAYHMLLSLLTNSVDMKNQTLDPLIAMVKSLLSQKNKLEHELSYAKKSLSIREEELSSTRASLKELKQRFIKLSETFTSINLDRASLRLGMDEVSTKIDIVKLSLVELRSTVVVGRRDVEMVHQLDFEISQRLKDYDKELHLKSMTCAILQEKLDEKSGLLVEERSKVLELEEKIEKLYSFNESVVQKMESKISMLTHEIKRLLSSQQTVSKDGVILTKDEQRQDIIDAITNIKSSIQRDTAESLNIQAENKQLKSCLVEKDGKLKSQAISIELLKKEIDDLKDHTVSKEILSKLEHEAKNSKLELNEAKKIFRDEKEYLSRNLISLQRELEDLRLSNSDLQNINRAFDVKLKNIEQRNDDEKNELLRAHRKQLEEEVSNLEDQHYQISKNRNKEQNSLIKSLNSEIERMRRDIERSLSDRDKLLLDLESERELRQKSAYLARQYEAQLVRYEEEIRQKDNFVRHITEENSELRQAAVTQSAIRTHQRGQLHDETRPRTIPIPTNVQVDESLVYPQSSGLGPELCVPDSQPVDSVTKKSTAEFDSPLLRSSNPVIPLSTIDSNIRASKSVGHSMTPMEDENGMKYTQLQAPNEDDKCNTNTKKRKIATRSSSRKNSAAYVPKSSQNDKFEEQLGSARITRNGSNIRKHKLRIDSN